MPWPSAVPGARQYVSPVASVAAGVGFRSSRHGSMKRCSAVKGFLNPRRRLAGELERAAWPRSWQTMRTATAYGRRLPASA